MRTIKINDETYHFKRVNVIPHFWGIAERETAERHLNDYGIIYVDEDDFPIENEYVTDCIDECYQ